MYLFFVQFIFNYFHLVINNSTPTPAVLKSGIGISIRNNDNLEITGKICFYSLLYHV